MAEVEKRETFYVGSAMTRVSPEKLAQLKQYGACVAADALSGFCSMDGRIVSMVPGNTVCGQAVTVQLRPGDNIMLHRAIEAAAPTDILVINTGGNTRNAVIGGIMTGAAFGKGIGGLVIDGAIRDVEELRENNYPVFAVSVVPNTGDSTGPGRMNQPISCGDQPVRPGDIILADDNGVTVIPLEWLDLALEGCEKKLAAERQRIDEIKAGQLTAARITARLNELGY